VAKIILHLKPGKPPNEPNSYRPIAYYPYYPKYMRNFSYAASFQSLKTAIYYLAISLDSANDIPQYTKPIE
jgi:hypothetical protein